MNRGELCCANQRNYFLKQGTTSLFAALLLTSKKLKKRSMKLSFPPILTAARTLSNLFLDLNDFEECIVLPLCPSYSEAQIQITFDIFFLFRALMTKGTAGIFEFFSPFLIDVCSIYSRTCDCVLPV